MQNHYVGDIGDFGKYGLLKFISSETKLKLGINWYLNDGEKNKDGKFYDYLIDNACYNRLLEFGGETNYKLKNIEIKDDYSKRMKICDEELYYQLRDIIVEWIKDNDTRKVQEIKNRQILGNRTDYYEDFIDTNNRKTWCEKGLKKLSNSEIVFFDPDNGLIINEEGNNNIKTPKHIYSDEIIPYFQRGQSLIIYQHATREKGVNFDDQLKRKALKLKEILSIDAIFIIRYKRRIARAYFIIPSKHPEISECVSDFMKTKWGQEEHFVLVQ